MTASRSNLKLVSSYVFDWIVIIVAFGIGALLGDISGNKRPFTLADPSISFPYVHKEKISVTVLCILAGLFPAVTIALICLILVPGRTTYANRKSAIRLKFWELHAGWQGLAMSCGTAFFLTSALKNLFGRPRPDLLARCNPDLENVTQYIVGGLGNQNVALATNLVSSAICRTSKSMLDDGFRSFPSGHSSFSFAGLLYLTLYISSKFQVNIPLMSPKTLHNGRISAIRHSAAAAPVYLLAVATTPVGLALYICSTRFSDFRHHGWDIFAGMLLGIITSVFSYYWYMIPIGRGAGWSWAPRAAENAWGIRIGTMGYQASHSDVEDASHRPEDEEQLAGVPLDDQVDLSRARPYKISSTM